MAARFIESVYSACHLLAERPGIGRPEPEFGHNVRCYVLGSYEILYQDRLDLLFIVRVLHQRRDIRRIFGVESD